MNEDIIKRSTEHMLKICNLCADEYGLTKDDMLDVLRSTLTSYYEINYGVAPKNPPVRVEQRATYRRKICRDFHKIHGDLPCLQKP
jgi:hypothetical protein